MEELIDDDFLKSNFEYDFNGISTFMDRVRHLAIDGITIFILTLLTNFNIIQPLFSQYVADPKILIPFTFLAIYLIYYLLLETLFASSFGKTLNKTRIINYQKNKPDFRQVLIRCLCRIIPFGQFLIFTPYQKPLHDILSQTWVVRIK